MLLLLLLWLGAMLTLIYVNFVNQHHSEQSLQTSVRVEDWVQLLLEVTTVVRIMTVKLHWSAVFNNGLYHTQVTTE